MATSESAEPSPTPDAVVASLQARLELPFVRLLTCGSVDDGKSTLLGRLLYDSGAVLDDHLASARAASEERSGRPGLDLAFLVDGLRSEREQGITIDVAYRHLFTRTRRFLLLDAPGHEIYTHNMASAASLADAALLVVDAERGVREQTLRHLAILRAFGVGTVVVAINKMDRVGFAARRYTELAAEVRHALGDFPPASLRCIPLVALDGDLVVHRFARMPWYAGPTLLECLEALQPLAFEALGVVRLPIQGVAREGTRRVLLGTLAAGEVALGDRLVASPSGRAAKVVALSSAGCEVARVRTGSAIGVVLEGEHDLGRGQVLAAARAPAERASRFVADLVWFGEKALVPEARLVARFGVVTCGVVVEPGLEVRDLHAATRTRAASLPRNSVGRATLAATTELALDAYRTCRATGTFLVVDPADGETVGAGAVVEVLQAGAATRRASEHAAARTSLPAPATGFVVWFSADGTSVPGRRATELEEALRARRVPVCVVAESEDVVRSAVVKALLAVGAGALVVGPPVSSAALVLRFGTTQVHEAGDAGLEELVQRCTQPPAGAR